MYIVNNGEAFQTNDSSISRLKVSAIKFYGENVVGLHYTAHDVGNTEIRIGVGLTNYVTDIHTNSNEMIISFYLTESVSLTII